MKARASSISIAAATALVFAVLVVFFAIPVWAAPLNIAVWNFDDSNTTVDSLNGSVSSATAAAGAGLASESFPQGNPTLGFAWSFTNWSTGALDATDCFEFAIDLTNFGGVTFSFDERRSGTGPRDFQVRYKVGAGSYSTLSTVNVPDDTNWRSQSVAVVSGSADDLAMRGQASVTYQICGYTAEGTSGTWRIDNVTFNASTGPNSVTLRTLRASAPLSPWAVALPLLGLVAAGGLVAWRRR